jgi:integrase
LLIEKAVALGHVSFTKTRQLRTVRLLRPLTTDLAEWRMACGRPDSRALVFPARDGGPWGPDDYRNWRRRVFAPAIRAVGIEGARPYDLRHSFCSLLLAEGQNPIEVAAQLGHSPTMTLNTYGHLIEKLRGQPAQAAEAIIRAAREKQAVTGSDLVETD